MEGVYNYNMCRLCGGRCCQREAGAYSPDDFPQVITKVFVNNLLRSNVATIDWWQEDTRRIFYLRPRHVKENNYIADKDNSNNKGPCKYWNSETGCILSNELKPMQCRLLEPNYFHETQLELCTVPPEYNADKKGMAFKWIAYQNILSVLVKLYEK